MQLDKEMRKDMLSRVKDALLDGDASKSIKFYNNSSILLCTISFSALDADNIGDRVAYKFKASDGSYVLRGTAGVAGTVSYFTIDGKVPDAVGVTEQLIRGSVGGFGSLNDMRFNRIDWTTNTNITLSNLSIVMLQGA